MQTVALNDLHLLNLKNRNWMTLAIFGEELPQQRWGHTLAASDKKLLIFGGMHLKNYYDSSVYEV